MKKNSKNASRILAAALSTVFTLNFIPVSAFAEQITETEETAVLNEIAEESVQETIAEENDLQEEILPVEDEEVSETEETVVQNYQVSVSVPEDMRDVCFAALNQNYELLSVPEGETVHLKAEAFDKEEKHCLIKCIRIGDEILFENENGQNVYENDILITGDMADENGNINISVELMQYYVVKLSYDTQQEIVSDGHEYLVFDKASKTVTATPPEGYRVSELRIDNQVFNYSENDYIAVVELEENQNHTVTAKFELNRYQITGSENNGNNISFRVSGKNRFLDNTASILYGQDVECRIKLQKSCYIDTIEINGELYPESLLTKDRNGCYFFTLSNVTQNIQVDVKSKTYRPQVVTESSDQTSENADGMYYDKWRAFTVSIYDMEDVMPSFEELIRQFVIQRNGELLPDEEKVIYCRRGKKKTLDGIEYDSIIVNLYFREDGEYNWSFQYKNRAGVSPVSTGITEIGNNISHFIVDVTNPTGSITVSEKKWQSLLELLTFGVYSNHNLSVTIEPEDVNNRSIEYYVSRSNKLMTKEQLEAIQTWTSYTGNFEIEDSDYYVVYARLTDKAGNQNYISSKGLIIDKSKIECKISFLNEEDSITIEGNSIYKNDVKVKIEATENDVFSGINQAEYWLEIDGDEKEHTVLYQFSEENPVYEELISEKSWEITIPKENSGLNTVLYVKVTDNAGNETIQKRKVVIDHDAPVLSVYYEDKNGNAVEPVKGKYFNFTDVTAVIRVEEVSFDEETLKNSITINGVSLKESGYPCSIKQDGNIHELRVSFPEEGEYQLNVSYIDEAGNPAEPDIDTVFILDETNPAGTVQIKENIWKELLSKLTFGIFENQNLEVEITSEDTSGIEKTEYYLRKIQQNEETLLMTKEELEQTASWTEYQGTFSIQKNDSNIVYVRITDNAGNVAYLSSDGYVFDETSCEILMTDSSSKDGQKKKIYSEDVNVDIKVRDAFPYSGIKSVNYWTEVNGQKMDDERTSGSYSAENLTSETDKNKEYDEWSASITIPAEYNSSNIKVHVKAEDFAGNIREQILKLDIDIVAPTVKVSFDNNKGVEDVDKRWYFHDARTAEITFTERSYHFDKQAALDSIYIQDIVFDGDTGSTLNKYDAVWEDNISKDNPDEDTHTLRITFSEEANYIFDIHDFSDKAGNQADVSEKAVFDEKSKGIHYFTIDHTPPEGYITAESAEGRYSIWHSVVEPLHFGFWSKVQIILDSECADGTSQGTLKKEYYKSTSTKALTIEELDKIKDWKDFGGLALSENEYCVVYIKMTDLVGNTSYISTDALIVDDSAPYDEMTPPDISMTTEQEESGIHNGDVSVHVFVDDPLINDAYSGLKTISYRILNMGQETETGTLYTFDAVNPQHEDLLKAWEGEITVSSELNNSNDVLVEIYAQDNAENGIVEYLPLSIDATSPEIAVSFSDNRAPGSELFRNRTARISITERNFSEKFVNISATKDGKEYNPTVEWSQTGGSGNGDDTVWYAEVPFSGDGEYTFSVNCTDLAANESNKPESTAFTVDGSLPKINVKLTEDDSTVSNENYYQNTRTATIIIDEKNFSQEKAQQGITVKKNGKPFEVPVKWTENDTVHTAVLNFSDDAEYSLTVSYTDEAGNAGTTDYVDKNDTPVTDYKNFCIDTKDPEVSISVNDKKQFYAYAEEVIPVISYQDTNFDNNQVQIEMSGNKVTISEPEIDEDTISFTLTGKREDESNISKVWTGKIEDITDDSGKICGKTLIFEDFPSDISIPEDKAFDDIYTISVSAKDKSGRVSNSQNPDKNSLTFSVNRFGSTYDTADEVKKIIGTYSQEAQEIIISEVNPNELKEYSVTLFKNNETLILEEGKDYDIISEGEETEWHEYTYKIHKDVFEDDGAYDIRLNSVDEAGNFSENALDTKNSNVSFIVDKTPPTAIVANLESNRSYYIDENKMTILMSANDNLKLSEVTVYLDDDKTVYQQWNEKEIEANFSDGEFTFEIDAEPLLASKSHQLKVICKDASGRENEPVVIDDFKIIVNDSVKPWIYTGIGTGAVLLIATAVIFARRRKNNRT